MYLGLPSFWAAGLGTTIGIVSTCLHYNMEGIKVEFPVSLGLLPKVKTLLDVDNKLKIMNAKEFTFEDFVIHPSDIFKAFSPYPKIGIRKKNKPCIGLCLNNSYFNEIQEEPSLEYPYNKYDTLNNYSQLYKSLLKMGWDIITLDSCSFSLEDKKYIIENYCECVIGYEGGIAHLCHCLDVPYIMFPWRNTSSDFSYTRLAHIDKKTFFLDSFQQLLNFSKNDLFELIENLHMEQGNNHFFYNEKEKIEVWNHHINYFKTFNYRNLDLKYCRDKEFLLSNPAVKELFELYENLETSV